MKCRTRTAALMKALGIEYISSTIKQSSLDRLKVCLLNNSITQKFYCMLMNEPTVRQVASKRFMAECPLTVMIKALIY